MAKSGRPLNRADEKMFRSIERGEAYFEDSKPPKIKAPKISKTIEQEKFIAHAKKAKLRAARLSNK